MKFLIVIVGAILGAAAGYGIGHMLATDQLALTLIASTSVLGGMIGMFAFSRAYSAFAPK